LLEHVSGVSGLTIEWRVAGPIFNIQCHGEHNSLLHLEATGGRTRAVQRSDFGEIVVASEEAAQKNGSDNVVHIDGQMAYNLGTPPGQYSQYDWRRPGLS